VAIDDDFRAESRASWNQTAKGWGEHQDWMFQQTLPVTAWLVEGLQPFPGQVILELAAGPGGVGLVVAERLESGRLISSDFAPEMVALASRNGEEQGLTNVEYRVLDAEQLDLPDESVDGAVCRWGFMLMADPVAALRETHRVLRPDGRLAFAVWTTPDRNLWMALGSAAAIELGMLEPPDPERPGPFSLGDPERLRAVVTGAGFDEPEIEEIVFAFHYRDFAVLWDVLVQLSARLTAALAEQPEPRLEELRALLVERLAPFKGADGSYTIPASSWGVLAKR
jgi:SAM-dependent methyltransferase